MYLLCPCPTVLWCFNICFRPRFSPSWHAFFSPRCVNPPQSGREQHIGRFSPYRAFLPTLTWARVFCFVAIRKPNNPSECLLVKHPSFRHTYPELVSRSCAALRPRSPSSLARQTAGLPEPADRTSCSPAPVCLIRPTIPLSHPVQTAITIHSRLTNDPRPVSSSSYRHPNQHLSHRWR